MTLENIKNKLLNLEFECEKGNRFNGVYIGSKEELIKVLSNSCIKEKFSEIYVHTAFSAVDSTLLNRNDVKNIQYIDGKDIYYYASTISDIELIFQIILQLAYVDEFIILNSVGECIFLAQDNLEDTTMSLKLFMN